MPPRRSRGILPETSSGQAATGKVGEAKRELAEMAKAHAEAALLTLLEIGTGDGAASARVCDATAILDRSSGTGVDHSAKGESLEGLAEVFESASVIRRVGD